MRNRKGEAFQMLVSMAASIGAVAVILVVTFLILSTGKTQIAETAGGNSTEYNATVDTVTAVADGIPAFLPIIIIAGVGAVLLALVSLFRKS